MPVNFTIFVSGCRLKKPAQANECLPMNTEDYAFTMPIRVRDYEVDSQGIVNNSNYLRYMEHTRHEFCRVAGTSFRALQEQGIDPVLRRAELDYLSPLRLGDEMLSCLSMRREGARFIFMQDIFRLPDNTPVCRGILTLVCIENGRLTRGDALAEAFADYL